MLMLTGRQGGGRGAEEVPQARGDAGDEGARAQLPRQEGGGAGGVGGLVTLYIIYYNREGGKQNTPKPRSIDKKI